MSKSLAAAHNELEKTKEISSKMVEIAASLPPAVVSGALDLSPRILEADRSKCAFIYEFMQMVLGQGEATSGPRLQIEVAAMQKFLSTLTGDQKATTMDFLVGHAPLLVASLGTLFVPATKQSNRNANAHRTLGASGYGEVLTCVCCIYRFACLLRSNAWNKMPRIASNDACPLPIFTKASLPPDYASVDVMNAMLAKGYARLESAYDFASLGGAQQKNTDAKTIYKQAVAELNASKAAMKSRANTLGKNLGNISKVVQKTAADAASAVLAASLASQSGRQPRNKAAAGRGAVFSFNGAQAAVSPIAEVPPEGDCDTSVLCDPFVVRGLAWIADYVGTKNLSERLEFMRTHMQSNADRAATQRLKSGRCQIYVDMPDLLDRLLGLARGGGGTGPLTVTETLAGHAGEHCAAILKTFGRPSVSGARAGSQLVATESGEGGGVRLMFEGSLRVAVCKADTLVDALASIIAAAAASMESITYEQVIQTFGGLTEAWAVLHFSAALRYMQRPQGPSGGGTFRTPHGSKFQAFFWKIRSSALRLG